MPVSLLVRLFFWLWFGAAVAAGHFIVLQRVPALAVPAVPLGLAGILLLGYFCIGPIRAWVDGIDLRTLVLLHATRFSGLYLLVLHQRGELPRAFAVPGGLGDIVVAIMALPIALAPLPDAARLRAIVIWNVVGLVNVLLILSSTARIMLADPTELRALTHLPLNLLPTFLIPLLIATHVIIFHRTARATAAR